MKFSEVEIIVGVILAIIVVAFLVNFFWINPSHKGFCGDGICSEDEKNSCELDCNWCGDGYCQENEDCSSCSGDCGNCKSKAYCGDGLCNPGECKTACSKDCKISDCVDGFCDSRIGENCKTSPTDCSCPKGQICSLSGQCSGGYCGNGICENNEDCSCSDCPCESSKKCNPNNGRALDSNGCATYCGNGICEKEYNESKSTCSLDCGSEAFKEHAVDPNTNYPIIFVHGHSVSKEEVSTFSINAFKDFQSKLDSENLYIDKAVILPNSEISAFDKGEWGRLVEPISVRTTYYIGNLDSSGTFIRADESERSINEYGQRLGQVVDIVLHHTGKNKAIIIAHSMGGLVSRAYIKSYGGQSKVDKLIEIGSPNHGIYGWLISGLCDNVHPGQECKDMQHNSSFLDNLNANDETPGSIKYMTLAGDCCSTNGERWDETIRVNSVRLEGAQNIIIEGNEVPGIFDTFHGTLISPSKVPEVYTHVKEFIK
ncbi:MAG: alpha/beta hydrolase [Candidatus Woesearchaeota archaeon]|nr:alpha/beta hydrolase [Candidatus Woesearchaeota archaeon]